jgi:hypothetical protein
VKGDMKSDDMKSDYMKSDEGIVKGDMKCDMKGIQKVKKK